MLGSVLKTMMAAAVIVAGHAPVSGGQIMRRPTARAVPNWVGGGVGITQSFVIDDGGTDSRWTLGQAIEYIGRFEHPTRSGIHVGLQGSFAKLPLAYTSSNVLESCQTGCDGTATKLQVSGLAQYGSGYGFHGVYELLIGVTGLYDFNETTSGRRIGPNQIDYDFSFAVGTGIGFGLSPDTMIEVVQQFGTILHQRTGLPAGTGSYPRVSVTRLGVKVAF